MTDELILGIDPGSQCTGYGIIKKSGSRFFAITYGCIRPKQKELAFRFRTIYEELLILIDTHQPNAVAVETQYVDKNVISAMKLGMARGIVMLAASMRELPLFEYTPSRAKKAATGSGRASKDQIHGMIQSLLNLKNEDLAEDAADALAIAICHAQNFIIR